MNIQEILKSKVRLLIVSIITLYLVLGFFILPAIVKSQATSWVNENLNAKIQIENVAFNPILFKFTLEGVSLNQEDKTLISFEAFTVDFDLARTISNGYIHFKLVNLNKPVIHALINKEKQLNLLSIVPEKASTKEPKTTVTKEPSEPLKLQLDKLYIEDATITFTDNSLEKPFSTTLEKVNFAVRDFNTRKDNVTAHSFDITIDKDAHLKGEGGLYLNPIKAYGSITLSNYALANYWESIKENYDFDFNKELRLNAHVGYHVTLENGFKAIINNTSMDLKNLSVYDKQKQTLLSLKEFGLKDVNVTYPLKPDTKSLDANGSVIINEGKITAQSKLNLEPLDVQSHYTIQQLPLDILNPIMSQFVLLQFKSAFVNSKGDISVKDKDITLDSTTALNDIFIVRGKETMFKSSEIKLNNINFDSKANKATIASIDVVNPYANVHINKQSKLNLAQIQKKTAKANSKPAKKDEEKKEALQLILGPLNIKNALVTFEDETLPIPFKTDIRNLQGFFSEFNNKGSKPSELDLKGGVGKYGHVVISGITTPNNIKNTSEIKLDFDNIAISDLTPYSGKFIGREIKDGKLSLKLDYIIKKAQLNAKNQIIIEKIQLGDTIESEDAVNLPLELAIAILEDSDGIIDLSLPIKGDLDNPEFSVAPIIWQAFTNIITKAITAPFSLLGSLFGFEEDEINQVAFNFGESAITPVQKEPLDKITEILTSRQKLAIKVQATYDSQNDTKALQAQLFDAFVKTTLKKVKDEDYQEEYLSLLEDTYESYDLDADDLKDTFEKDKELDLLGYEEALKETIVSKQVLAPDALDKLAQQRIENIKSYLISKKIDPSQLTIIDGVKSAVFEKKTLIGVEVDTAK